MEKVFKRIDKELTFYEKPKGTDTKQTVTKLADLKNTQLLTLQIPYDDASLEKYCFDPFVYAISAPGNNVRQTIVDTLNYWLKVPNDVAQILKDIAIILQYHIILLDDVEDNSTTRRCIPCAHHVFGPTVSKLNLVLMACMLKVRRLPHPQAVRVYLESVLNYRRGQVLEIYWRETSKCPTIEEYFRMCFLKTGSAFVLVNNMIQLFSKNQIDTGRLMELFGLYYQVNDDYQNLTNIYYHKSKGFCEDITEGKFGYPIVHAANTNPEIGAQLIEILRQRTTDIELKKYCLSLIEQCGSFENTKQLLKDLMDKINEERRKFPPNPYFDKCLDSIIRSSL